MVAMMLFVDALHLAEWNQLYGQMTKLVYFANHASSRLIGFAFAPDHVSQGGAAWGVVASWQRSWSSSSPQINASDGWQSGVHAALGAAFNAYGRPNNGVFDPSERTLSYLQTMEAERAASVESRRQKLIGLKMSTLRKQAESIASASAVEEAEDSSKPRAALINLILEATETSPQDKTDVPSKHSDGDEDDTGAGVGLLRPNMPAYSDSVIASSVPPASPVQGNRTESTATSKSSPSRFNRTESALSAVSSAPDPAGDMIYEKPYGESMPETVESALHVEEEKKILEEMARWPPWPSKADVLRQKSRSNESDEPQSQVSASNETAKMTVPSSDSASQAASQALAKPDQLASSDLLTDPEQPSSKETLTWKPPALPQKGWTSIHKAVFSGDDTALQKLLQLGAAVNRLDARQNTPLHIASAVPGRAAAIEALLADKRINPLLCNADGHTPLHMACLHRQLRSAQLLLAHAEAQQSAPRKQRANRLRDSRITGKTDEPSMLEKLVSATDVAGRTALQLVSDANHEARAPQHKPTLVVEVKRELLRLLALAAGNKSDTQTETASAADAAAQVEQETLHSQVDEDSDQEDDELVERRELSDGRVILVNPMSGQAFSMVPVGRWDHAREEFIADARAPHLSAVAGSEVADPAEEVVRAGQRLETEELAYAVEALGRELSSRATNSPVPMLSPQMKDSKQLTGIILPANMPPLDLSKAPLPFDTGDRSKSVETAKPASPASMKLALAGVGSGDSGGSTSKPSARMSQPDKEPTALIKSPTAVRRNAIRAAADAAARPSAIPGEKPPITPSQKRRQERIEAQVEKMRASRRSGGR